MKAVKWELVQTISTQLRESVQRYWDLVFTKGLLEIRRQSLKRLQFLTDSVERLIEGGQMAASEINQQYAELYTERRLVAQAEQDVFAALNNLIFAVGGEVGQQNIPSNCILPELYLEKYPEISGKSKVCCVSPLFDLASQWRGDLIASRWRIESSKVLVRNASNNLLPEFNAIGNFMMRNNTVNNDAKPFFGAVTSKRPQTDWSASFSFSYPFCNDAAKGDYRRLVGVP